MHPLAKYVLMQVPGAGFVALVLLGLWHWADLSTWLAMCLFLLWVGKDAAMYPLLRRAYEPSARTGAARLIGRRGVARQPLAPRGYVWLDGELWRAEVEPGGAPIPAGVTIVVTGARRLTLTVTATERESS